VYCVTNRFIEEYCVEIGYLIYQYWMQKGQCRTLILFTFEGFVLGRWTEDPSPLEDP
jgi:hypothetical protein